MRAKKPQQIEKLQVKSFQFHKDMLEWANSEDGTDYIISIVLNQDNLNWYIFFIK